MSGKRSASRVGQVALTPPPIARELLAGHTDARIALGRAGTALPTRAQLAFVGDHARARDAVRTAVDFAKLERALGSLGLATLRLHSEAPDRAGYLRRPDLGRRLDAASQEKLAQAAWTPQGRVALVVADGLSAEAVQTNAVPLVAALLPLLAAQAMPVASVVLVEQGRVAVGDPVGQALGADLVVLLVGERPGLSAADSLGCYLTFAARPGTPDSLRNCVSNIRDGGLAPADAAARIARLARRAIELGRTGTMLKDDEAPPAVGS